MKLSIIIPTFNSSEHLTELWETIHTSGLYSLTQEAIFVDDGSTDMTKKIIESLIETKDPRKILILLDLKSNKGRFLARLEGAKASNGDSLLFIDTRARIPAGFGVNLNLLAKDHPVIMANIKVDLTRGIFCVYWDRAHRFFFPRHFEDVKKRLFLTNENFDDYLKGTTTFYSTKEIFLKACAKFHQAPLNDDVTLMKEIVTIESILVDPSLEAFWFPRPDLIPFLKRLFERGPSFVEYHVFKKKGALFYCFLLEFMTILTFLVLLITKFNLALILFFFCLLLVFFSTFLVAKGFKEFLLIAPIHSLALLSFCLGTFLGFWLILFKKVKRKFNSIIEDI